MRCDRIIHPNWKLCVSRLRLHPAALAACGLAVFSLTGTASAQNFRLHAAGGIGHAVGGFQQRELGFGGTAQAAFELLLLREIGFFGQASGTWLGASAEPKNPTFAPLDAASSYAGMAGIHLRPFAHNPGRKAFSLAGLWASGAGGIAYTGNLSRPVTNAEIGLDLLFSKGALGLGPMLGWEHVFQPNKELRPDDANVLFVGLHGMFEIRLKDVAYDGDRDGDGIADSVDQCPDDPEDKDGFQDQDGCPDKDNDQDSIVDVYDKCPNIPEDKDGFQDSDGCPDVDNDQDGILDVSDKCPNDPEDKDGFEDQDGCPDVDNDKDGIPDSVDLCPNEPETVNGYADEDGCPDAEQIRVVGDKIILDDRVHFMVNAHIIRGISYPLLDRLARLIIQHPEYIHIEVQGHTDERGPDWYNDRLSQDRANAVLEFLISRGVNRERLSAHGFGKSKPLVEKNSEYAWSMNRRVEFEITRQKAEKIFLTLTSDLPKDTAPPAPNPATSSGTPAVETQPPPGNQPEPEKQDTPVEAAP